MPKPTKEAQVTYQHPAKHIKEKVMPYLKMNSDKFAEHIGVTKQFMKDFLDEKMGMTKELAKSLGSKNIGTERHWMKWQENYNQSGRQNQSMSIKNAQSKGFSSNIK